MVDHRDQVIAECERRAPKLNSIDEQTVSHFLHDFL